MFRSSSNEHYLSGPREGGPKRTVTNGCNERAPCGGGAPFHRYCQKGHRQRSDPLGRQRRNDEGNALSDRFFTQRGEDLSG